MANINILLLLDFTLIGSWNESSIKKQLSKKFPNFNLKIYDPKKVEDLMNFADSCITAKAIDRCISNEIDILLIQGDKFSAPFEQTGYTGYNIAKAIKTEIPIFMLELTTQTLPESKNVKFITIPKYCKQKVHRGRQIPRIAYKQLSDTSYLEKVLEAITVATKRDTT